jgi:hypothetical protein
VLTRDVRLEGFTTSDWVRLGDVLRPQSHRPREHEPELLAEPVSAPVPRGGIIAVTTGSRLRKLLSTQQGRLDPKNEPWPAALADLAHRHQARWAIELGTGALDELMDRFALRLKREHDYSAQVLEFIGAVRELEAEGAVRLWPPRLDQWPMPSERILLHALEAFCPDGKAVMLGVFAHGEVATCLVMRRRGSGFDLVVGPDDLRNEMGLTSGDWTRDYRHLARAAEYRVAPLALGCFGELATFQDLAARSSPGAWAAAVAARDIILSPVVPAVAIPLGIDAGRAAVLAVRELADRLGARSWLEQASTRYPALERVRGLYTGERDLKALLGFDPWSILRKLLYRTDPPVGG